MKKMLVSLGLLWSCLLRADPMGMDHYVQQIEITFKSEAAASVAQLRMLPLYHGFDQAFSSRWDDNHMGDLKVREIMAQYGQKGTFFLNDSAGYHEPSESGMVLADPGKEMAKALRVGGNSIGAHSLNHEFVPYLSRNRQFYEVLGCRVDREINSQSPVLAYAFSFLSIRNPLDEGSQWDLGEILKRAGFYHISEHMWAQRIENDFLLGTLICGDGGQPQFSGSLESELAKPRAVDDKPLWVVSMHPWALAWGGPEFPLLRALYKKWSGKKNWWYCDQNAYAAYRWQFLYSRVQVLRSGKTLKLNLERPDPLDLNDLTPLSLALKGVKASDIVEIRSPHAKLVRFEFSENPAFDLYHDKDRGLPDAYGFEASGLQASLSLGNGNLKLALKNNSAKAIRSLRVAFRLPLKYSPGVVKRSLEGIGPGETRELEIPLFAVSMKKFRLSWEAGKSRVTHELQTAADTALEDWGRAYEVAQVDAAYEDGRRVRGYASCWEPAPQPDGSFPQGAFLVKGPFGADQLELAKSALKDPKALTGAIAWSRPAAELSEPLGPEIIVAGGKNNSRTFYKWDKNIYHPGPDPLRYVMWANVEASQGGLHRAIFDEKSVEAMLLNGKAVLHGSLELKKGSNDLRILYAAQAIGPQSSFSPNHYGAWFRLLGPRGERTDAVRYALPTLP
ncbi:MAG: hypothetical protein V4498_02205 [candidate division FCPU426 bacterium]